MKYKLLITLFLLLSGHLNAADENNVFSHDHPIPLLIAYADTVTTNNGRDIVGVRLGLIHNYPQPTNYTCGASTIAHVLDWEVRKKGGFPSSPVIPTNIYERVNTAGGLESGLTTPEIKDGLKNEIDRYRYRRPPYNSDGSWINFSAKEDGRRDIDQALVALKDMMKKNFSPVILYGNTPVAGILSSIFNAGGHYYAVNEVISCNCSELIDGVKIMDSVYGSPAFPAGHILHSTAIKPWVFMTKNELSGYWARTGHANPFSRRHLFLANNHNGI